MRAGDVAGRADGADHVTGGDDVAGGDVDRGLVGVPDLGAVLEREDGLVAVGAVVAGGGDHTAGHGDEGGAGVGGEVQAGVVAGPQAVLAEGGGQAVAGQRQDPAVLGEDAGALLGLLGELAQGLVALLGLSLDLGLEVGGLAGGPVAVAAHDAGTDRADGVGAAEGAHGAEADLAGRDEVGGGGGHDAADGDGHRGQPDQDGSRGHLGQHAGAGGAARGAAATGGGLAGELEREDHGVLAGEGRGGVHRLEIGEHPLDGGGVDVVAAAARGLSVTRDGDAGLLDGDGPGRQRQGRTLEGGSGGATLADVRRGRRAGLGSSDARATTTDVGGLLVSGLTHEV